MPHGQNTATVAKKLGRVVAEIRKAKGLTQKELADAMKVSTQRWSSIEHGKTNLTISTVTDVANALDVRVSDLFREPKGRVIQGQRGRPKGS